MDTNLATLLGHLSGDGNLFEKKYRISYISREMNSAINFKELLNKCFKLNNKCDIKKEKNIWWVICYDKIIFYKLKLYFENNTLHDSCKIPKEILKKEKYFCAFLKGLYSDDGSIMKYRGGKKYRISLSLTSKELMLDVQNCLNKLGININLNIQKQFQKVGNKLQYKLDIEKPEHIKIFYEKISFNDFVTHTKGRKKQDILKEAYLEAENKLLIKNKRLEDYNFVISEYNKGKSMYSIYKETGLPRWTVESWIKKERKVNQFWSKY